MTMSAPMSAMLRIIFGGSDASNFPSEYGKWNTGVTYTTGPKAVTSERSDGFSNDAANNERNGFVTDHSVFGNTWGIKGWESTTEAR